MCNESCIDFGRRTLASEDVSGKRVLEVGALDVNGSLRPLIKALSPSEYVGIDIEMGPNVDEVCDASHIVDRFGVESFDLVVTTEMLEHVRDWRSTIANLKQAVSVEGVLVITTRSFGVPYHAYPNDFWRYELDDMNEIFSDFEILALEPDVLLPGVLFKGRKPRGFTERDLSDYSLYSIVTRKRSWDISELDLLICKARLAAGRTARKLRLMK